MNITEELAEACRWLSKSGTFSPSEAYLRQLSTSLSPSEVLELHAFFRDESQRYESEWREEFLALFPQSEGLLPEIDESEFWQKQLFQLIRSGDLSAVQEFIHRIGTAQQQFDPQETYSECASMGFRYGLPDVPCDFYPVEGGDETGITAIGLATELGHADIAAFLDGIISQLDQRFIAAYEEGKVRVSEAISTNET